MKTTCEIFIRQEEYSKYNVYTSKESHCENIPNEFQIYFETHFLLLETLLDRNKLTAHFPVKPDSRSEF